MSCHRISYSRFVSPCFNSAIIPNSLTLLITWVITVLESCDFYDRENSSYWQQPDLWLLIHLTQIVWTQCLLTRVELVAWGETLLHVTPRLPRCLLVTPQLQRDAVLTNVSPLYNDTAKQPPDGRLSSRYVLLNVWRVYTWIFMERKRYENNVVW